MRWQQIPLLAGVSAALASLPITTHAAPVLQLNGWHVCAMDIGSADATVAASISAQCATVTMPLCHQEVCNDNEQRTVELFVKRIPAKTNTSTKNLWLLPDHPFTMSGGDVERQMVLLHQQLQGDVSVYLMDQRGTGRSTLFDCEASQATSKVSTRGVVVAASEAATCADALRTQFGTNFAKAFSLTSAARDVVTFISNFQAKTKVFLYGVGFGTHLVQRVMHFPSNEIIGFVFDSAATTAGGSKKEFPYRSRADKDFGDVAKDVMALCDESTTCGVPQRATKAKTLKKMLEDVLEKIDRSTDPFCPSIATLLRGGNTTNSSDSASSGLRRVLASMLQQLELRALIPVVVYRLDRCEDRDVAVLSKLLRQILMLEPTTTSGSSRTTGASLLVFDLIQFSELWESPPPSASELATRFNKTLFSQGVAVASELERYCAFTQDATAACNAYRTSGSDNSAKLSYDRDAYWNVAAPIREQASVLLLSSRYDGETPVAYAQTLFDSLESGSRKSSKELLIFDSSTHNVLVSTPLLTGVEDRSLDATPSCARAVLASFVENDGDLKSYDASCIAQLPGASSLFNISETLSLQVLGVADPYDGVLPLSGSGSGSTKNESSTISAPLSPSSDSSMSEAMVAELTKSRNRYRTAFIVVLVVAVLLLAGVALLWYRAYKKRLLEEEELQLRQLRGEEVDDMEFLRELYNPSPTEWFNYRSNRMHL